MRRFIEWQGQGTEEVGRRSSGEVVVRIDPRYFRPTEVETLLGNPSKAHEKLGWTPTTTLEQRLKGFNVVGSMENPPTNPEAVAAAHKPG